MTNRTMTDKQLPAVAVRNRDEALDRLQSLGLVLPSEAVARLDLLGPEHARTALATCVALGISPALLAISANIKVIGQAVNLVTKYRFTPGEYFYMLDFAGGSAEGAEASEVQQAPKDKKVKLLALIRSYKAYEHNATQHFRSMNMKFVYRSPQPVVDAKERDEMIEFFVGPYAPNPQDRVMKACYIPVIEGKAYPELADWKYGIYLHNKIQRPTHSGSMETVAYGLAKANKLRSGADIARTRAVREAARGVTTEDWPVTGEDAVDIVVRTFQMANQNAARVEEAIRYGAAENVDDALDFVAEGNTIDLRSETVKQLDGIASQPKSADPKGESQTETSSGASPQPAAQASPPDWQEPAYTVTSVETPVAVVEARRETAKSVVAELPTKDDIDALAGVQEATGTIGEADVILDTANSILRSAAPEAWEMILALGELSPDDDVTKRASTTLLKEVLAGLDSLMGWGGEIAQVLGATKAQGLLYLITGTAMDKLPSEASAKEVRKAVVEKSGKIENDQYDTNEMIKRRELIHFAGQALDEGLNG